MMSVAHILSSNRQELPGEQRRVWTQAVQDLELDLDPYDGKASYVCGMVRQFIEAAGMQLGHQYHVGALVSAASAAELLGWCCTGATNRKDEPWKRLPAGIGYLEAVGPPYPGTVHHPAGDLVRWVRSIRNFGAHGAAHDEHLILDQVLTVWLLRSLARALDEFWVKEGDLGRHQRFARAAITPLYTQGKPIFVWDVQHHLEKGLMPGARLDHEAGWRPEQPWEDHSPMGVVRMVPLSSPAVTGTPDPPMRHHPG
jgi:hypothetical protein